MKTEDFERLKQICEKEGFSVQHYCVEDTFTIWKKDPWEGVEFAEDKQGIIWPIRNYGFDKKIYKPSTETAYIEQLKRIAKEKLGEIKEGDRFKCPTGTSVAILLANKEWDYVKEYDTLYFYNVEVYNSGKWAERVNERVKVDYDSWTRSNTSFVISFEHNENDITKFDRVPEFLCEQLEKYLNDEKGN